MKKVIATLSALTLGITISSAQDMYQSEVPSVIVNNFQKTFPKASDIEWEIKGEVYEVEFETGFLGDEHKAYYTRNGKLVRHEEEISKSSLPKSVLATINKNYSGYRLDDLKRISGNGKVLYKVDLDSFKRDWKVVFDAQGRILEKRED